jgi:hypothetical protein
VTARATTVLLWAGVLASGCGGVNLSPVTIPDSNVTLPKRVRQLVRDQWPGARVAADAAAGNSCTAQASPPVVTGDFDGDGASDYILRVVAADGVHLAAALARLRDFKLVDVSGSTAVPAGALQVMPRGQEYHQGDSLVDFYFGVDTATVTPCGGAPTAYFWKGAAFEPGTITPVEPAPAASAEGASAR